MFCTKGTSGGISEIFIMYQDDSGHYWTWDEVQKVWVYNPENDIKAEDAEFEIIQPKQLPKNTD